MRSGLCGIALLAAVWGGGGAASAADEVTAETIRQAFLASLAHLPSVTIEVVQADPPAIGPERTFYYSLTLTTTRNGLYVSVPDRFITGVTGEHAKMPAWAVPEAIRAVSLPETLFPPAPAWLLVYDLFLWVRLRDDELTLAPETVRLDDRDCRVLTGRTRDEPAGRVYRLYVAQSLGWQPVLIEELADENAPAATRRIRLGDYRPVSHPRTTEVPVVMDIPVAGRLFRREAITNYHFPLRVEVAGADGGVTSVSRLTKARLDEKFETPFPPPRPSVPAPEMFDDPENEVF